MTRVTEAHMTSLREHGYVIVEGFLDATHIANAREHLTQLFPTWEQYESDGVGHAEISSSSPKFWVSQAFPALPAELQLNVLTPELIRFAQTFIGTDDVVADQSIITAKYAGQHTVDQSLHADYINHTLAWPQEDYLAGMLYYADVSADLGATRIVSRKHTDHLPLVPDQRPRELDPELYEHERAVEGPAGTMLLYTLRTFHRGAAITAASGARFNHHFCYKPARTPWLGWSSWPREAPSGEMARLLQMCTVEQRSAMGFPRPGDPYWTSDTLTGVALRYPDMDMEPYRAATGVTA